MIFDEVAAMQIRFNMTIHDVITFWTYCDKHVPYLKQRRLVRQFIYPVVLLSIFSFGLLNGTDLSAAWISPIYILFLLLPVFPIFTLVLLYMAFYPRWRMYQIKKDIINGTKENDKYIKEPFVYTIKEEGLHIKNFFSDGTIMWSAFKEIVMLPSHIFFFYEEANAYIIPTGAFYNADQAHVFTDTLRQCYEQATGKKLSSVSADFK